MILKYYFSFFKPCVKKASVRSLRNDGRANGEDFIENVVQRNLAQWKARLSGDASHFVEVRLWKGLSNNRQVLVNQLEEMTLKEGPE